MSKTYVFKTRDNQSPIGGAIPVDTDMSVDTAKKLQTVAWETVQHFQKNQ
ncbi:hypothetical protein VAEKB19_2790004 [Vibrio aestuarianus]|nr:hypothetical protein VAEKB19_2790004 [Vibrio aestuarianus]